MPSILFGSISTLADTSELQRQAFNRAFIQHGLDWNWDRPEYISMLNGNGGSARIAKYAAEHGQDVDAGAVHATKSALFQRSLATAELVARPGVIDSIAAAKGAGHRTAFVTTTSAENIQALLQNLPGVQASDFDLITDVSSVDPAKPDPAVYLFALDALHEEAATALAVEDNIGGVRSAVAAGLRCLAFPNQNTTDQPFAAVGQGVRVVHVLEPADLSFGGRY